MSCFDIEKVVPHRGQFGEDKELKEKIICEVHEMLSLLRKGRRPDLRFLKQEIQLLDMKRNGTIDPTLGMYLTQYYINNTWQARF